MDSSERTEGVKGARWSHGPRPAAMEPLEARLLLDACPLITEFMAVNSEPWYADNPDSDWDWIELHNPTAGAISLDGWHLTDNRYDLTKWTFPDGVTLAPGQYRLVFASGLEDGDPDHPNDLHADFKLSGSDPEYLALVKPRGWLEDVVHAYAPTYPVQVEDISYGLPVVTSVYDELVLSGAAATYHVPTAGDDVFAWTEYEFDDSSWTSVFTVDPAGVLITEISTGDTRFVELQNVSADAVDTTGWVVLANDAAAADINAVHATAWNLPAAVAPGEVLYRTDEVGENYWGSPIHWDAEGPGWAMMLDSGGQVMDFVAWGYTQAEIASLSIDYGAFSDITVGDAWSGDGAAAGTLDPGGTGEPTFVAFNDHKRGAGTHTNTTNYTPNDTPSGLLKDIVTGQFTDVTLTTSEQGVSWEGAQGNPAPGTDAYEIFNGYVDLSGASGSGSSIAITGGDYILHTFSGLEVGGGVTYTFAGTAVRGRDGYTNRWTRVSLEGAASATAAYSVGDGVVVISDTEVAIWTGENHESDQGFVAAWTEIDPGPDGEFSVRSMQYTGSTPLGPANGSKGYGIAGIRLEEVGPSGPLSYLVRSGQFDTDGADDFTRKSGATAGQQNPNLTVPFGEARPVTTGIGYTDGNPDFQAAIRTDVSAAMEGTNASLWIRIPFSVDDVSLYDELVLRMKYDAGFVAYLNGFEVARANAADPLACDSAATDERDDGEAVLFDEIDISDHLATALWEGSNVLAVHGLNSAADDNDFLIVPELVAGGTLEDPQYMTTPTPGAENVPGALGLVADTRFSIDRGFFDEPFELAISTASAGATIYYTTDGSEPAPIAEDRYTGPVTISTTTTLRAMAHKPGWIPSHVGTQTYPFLADVIRQATDPDTGAQVVPDGYPDSWGHDGHGEYQMDPDVVDAAAYRDTLIDDMKAIPTLSLVMDHEDLWGSNQIYLSGARIPRATSVELIHPDGAEGFQIDAAVQIQGGTSTGRWKVDKLSMRLKFKEPYGPTELDYDLFGEGAVDHFDTLILDARMNNTWLHPSSGQRILGQYTRDQYVSDLQLAMGDASTHGLYVHLYLNGLYWGLYCVHERPDEHFSADYYGGDPDDYHVLKHGSGNIVHGTNADYNAMFSVASGVSDPAKYEQLKGYLDVDDFIDYMLVNFYVGNTDWAHHNWYASRNVNDPDGRWRFYSWDAEHVLKGVNDNAVGKNNSGAPTGLHQRLLANSDYRMLVADHIHRHFFNDGLLTPDRAAALYQVRLDEIDRAIVGESARWGDNRKAIPYTRDVEWVNERDRLLNTYFPQRTAIVLGQLRSAGLYPSVVAPSFNQHGGEIAGGFPLTISAPAGTVYYTTDGTDPRLPGGGTSASARIYTGTPVILSGNAHVKSRALAGGTWSALNEATFVVPGSLSDVRITEIMYNPAPPDTSTGHPEADFPSNESFEFIELQNVGGQAVNPAGLQLVGGIRFTFPTMDLAPGQHVLVVRSEGGFEARYGTGHNIAGRFDSITNLANSGERTALGTTIGETLQEFTYNDNWYDLTDGRGYSLVVCDPRQDAALWDSKEGWRTSWHPGGNPGQADTGYNPGSVVISEVLAHTDEPSGDWIELKNTTADQTIDITGWYLSDDPADLAKWTIPATAPLGPGACVLFTQADDFGAAFGLSEFGDEVCLTAAEGTQLRGYREDEDFGASDRDVTFGRYLKSTGGKDFVALTAPTPGNPNAGPIVPDVVINEIMYHPAPGGHEFIELVNRSGRDVALHDDEPTPNPWQLTDGVRYAFPGDASIPAGGRVLVVGIDPDTFRSTYGVAADVPIYGPWDGALENAGERVELSRPGQPEWTDPPPGQPPGYVPYIVVEKVTYNDVPAWPTDPDGLGPSLERLAPGDYANDPANWSRSAAAGGTPGAANSVLPPARDWLGSADDHWENAANWSAGAVPDPETRAVLGGGAAHEPTLYQDQSIQGVDFAVGGWTLGGVGRMLTVGPDGVNSVGSNTVHPHVRLAAPSVWTVEGVDTLNLTGSLDGGGQALTKDGGGTLRLSGAQDLAALNVSAGTLGLAPGGTASLATQALTLAPGATLDLADGNLVVDYPSGASPFDAVAAWVASGCSGGAWDGPGIASGAAAAHAQDLTALGVIDNSDPDVKIGGLSHLDGVPVDPTSVLVKYTWWGDANLDGVVDSNDYDMIDNAWLLWTQEGKAPEGGFRWAVGDFNYDGVIDSNDYDRIDSAWLLQGGALGGGEPVAATTPSAPARLPPETALPASRLVINEKAPGEEDADAPLDGAALQLATTDVSVEETSEAVTRGAFARGLRAEETIRSGTLDAPAGAAAEPADPPSGPVLAPDGGVIDVFAQLPLDVRL